MKWLRNRKVERTYGKKHGLDISQSDVWKDQLFALDEGRKLFLYVRTENSALYEELIDLGQVQLCKIHKYTTGRAGTEAHRISRLVLVFTFSELSVVKMLTIFNIRKDESDDIPFCFDLVKKWAKLINKNILVKPTSFFF